MTIPRQIPLSNYFNRHKTITLLNRSFNFRFRDKCLNFVSFDENKNSEHSGRDQSELSPYILLTIKFFSQNDIHILLNYPNIDIPSANHLSHVPSSLYIR